MAAEFSFSISLFLSCRINGRDDQSPTHQNRQSKYSVWLTNVTYSYKAHTYLHRKLGIGRFRCVLRVFSSHEARVGQRKTNVMKKKPQSSKTREIRFFFIAVVEHLTNTKP